ncbi:MAG: UDP-N-acetylmuramate dehydrogenase [Acidimicrobiia bacterium]|nr:UDP-N-acetylmuramate dehydrogenase [Acidimicrobiia bacterium]MBT8216568.1 UDP-N-acetylmuramate dehydrogenase [Acidimicrobiia bacterium]NNF11218.1 UDP-N-acetylmuramate dehydrogenase [Acidimicrobiia bacterium]NNL68954.1 UDP-N-acetylmuramate dehydrogenase [Acidimicrobiia bacterium]
MSGFGELVAAGRVAESVRLGALTTYKLGGPARYFIEIAAEQDLIDVAAALAEDPQPVLVIGRGSNLVIADAGWPGLAIRFGNAFAGLGLGPAPDHDITAGAAVPLPRLARESVNRGRGGLEFYVGIPGSVGGAIRTNAGGHGSETADCVRSVRVFDLASGRFRDLAPGDLSFQYRSSSLTSTDLVVTAVFQTHPIEVGAGQQHLREITRWRRVHQPGGTLNAGSVFRNPPGDAAGRLIDELGLKGFSVGGAAVSTKHANFFEAAPSATAQDVHDLVAAVRAQVLAKTGVDLVPEVQFAGPFT